MTTDRYVSTEQAQRLLVPFRVWKRLLLAYLPYTHSDDCPCVMGPTRPVDEHGRTQSRTLLASCLVAEAAGLEYRLEASSREQYLSQSSLEGWAEKLVNEAQRENVERDTRVKDVFAILGVGLGRFSETMRRHDGSQVRTRVEDWVYRCRVCNQDVQADECRLCAGGSWEGWVVRWLAPHTAAEGLCMGVNLEVDRFHKERMGPREGRSVASLVPERD